MKKTLFLVLLLFKLHADLITTELKNLDNLIDVTRQNLENEIELKKMIEIFGQLQIQVEVKKEDKDLFLKLVTQAEKIQRKINTSYLKQTFSPEFLQEIEELSQMSSGNGKTLLSLSTEQKAIHAQDCLY